MVASQGIPQQHKQAGRNIGSEELINRMAAELRAKGDPDFPHSYYVVQVRRQLAGEPSHLPAANDQPATQPSGSKEHSSVFHAWALAE